jgi:molybdopterin/thiamine biosynthesis adenylyltransferase
MTPAAVPPDFYAQAFQRNLGLIAADEQEVLRNACVAVAGVGGVGALHLLALARMGVGRFHIADFDTFELTNFNRQFGATIDTIGRQKIEVMQEMVRGINPGVDLGLFCDGVQPDNIERFLEDVHVVVDGLDFFAFEHRRLLFSQARSMGLYVLTSGPVGFGSTLQIFSPKGMSFDEYFGFHDGMSEFDKFVAFATGLAPAAFARRYMDLSKVKLSAARGPVVAPSCILSSALVATETVNILLRRRPVQAVPHYFQFDMLLHKYRKGYLAFGARNPMQYVKRFVLRRTMRRFFAKSDATA